MSRKISRAFRRRNRRSVATGACVVSGVIAAVGATVLVGTSVGHSASAAADSRYVPPSLPGVSAVPVRPLVAFIGDSWTAGSAMGGVGQQNYSFLVAQHQGWYSTNLGVGGSGYLAGEPLANFGSASRMAALAGVNANLVFVVDGVNDLNQAKGPQDEYAAALKTYQAVQKAAPRARIVVIGFIAPGPSANFSYFSGLNDALERAARSLGLTFWNALDEDWFGGQHASLIGADHFHPTNTGDAYLASVIDTHISAAGLSSLSAS